WSKAAAHWTRVLRAYADPGCRANCLPFAETLALAVDGQYFVVPWGFMGGAMVAHPETPPLVGQQNAKNVESRVASHGALLKVERPLIPSFYRGQIRSTAPTSDENLFVLTSRNIVEPGARFVATRTDGPSVLYKMAYHGEGEGPVFYFDPRGNLIAMGDS